MAVRKKVVAIVVWSLCGAFLVAVTVLAVLLWCRRLRQRRHRLQLQSQQQQHAHYDHTSLYIKDDVDVVDVESSRRNTNAEAAARVGARDTHEQARYHGYTRGRVVELQTLPPAGAHTTPLLVHILACAAAAATAADDNVARRGAHTHATATIDADAATSVTATQALRGVGDYHSTISSGSGNSTRTAAAAAAASAAASLSRCDILVRVRAASACAGDALDPVAVVNRQLHCRHDDGGDGDTYGDTSMYADAAAVVVAPDTITTNTQQQQSQQQQSQQASPSPHVLLLSPTACEQCYGDDHFLRYTSPLFFAAAGVYVVDAYTVRPYAQRVSVVHRFLFAVRTPPPPPRDARVRVHSDVTRAHVVPAHTQHSHRPTRAKEVEVTLDGQWLTAPVQHTHRRHRHHDAAAAMGAVPPTQPTAASSTSSPPPPPPSSSTSSSSTSILTACVYAPHTGLPLPPHIVPERGDVTTATPIVITPHEQSTTPDQIRYSIDGSYPTLLYSGPFTLSVPSLASPATALSSSSSPPPPSTAMVTVRAVSVTAAMMPVAHTPTTASSTRRSSRLPPMVPTPHATSATLLQQQQQQQQGLSSSSPQSPAPTTAAATCSAVSEAVLRVRYAGYSYYDARLPAPSLRLHAVGAQLYFDERATPAGACTVYQLLSVHAARTRVQFDRRRCSVYAGVPITIAHDVAMVCAWTVDAAMLHGEAGEQKQQQQQQRREEEQGRSRAPGSAATRAGLVLSEVDSDVESRDSYVVTTSTNTVAAATRQHGALPPRRQHRRSCAVVYDCNRAAIRHTTPSARRLAQQHDQQRQEHATTTTTASTLSSSSSFAPSPPPLPAPVPCIACKEVSVAFDDVPASAMIVYTLNESEPALYDVVPPACAVPLTSASRHTKERQQQHYHDVHGRSSSRHTDNNDKTSGSNNNDDDDDDDDDDELVRGDEGGLHTFRYVPGTHIPLTLLATRPVCVTARVFMPLYRDSESAAVVHGTVSTVTAGVAAGGAAAAGGGVTAAAAGGGGGGRVLLGYRYGDVFRRTFYFAGDGGSSSSGSGMNSTSNLVAAAGDGGGQC